MIYLYLSKRKAISPPSPLEKYRGTPAVKKQSLKNTISSAGQIAKALLLCHTAHLVSVLHIPKAELLVKWVTLKIQRLLWFMSLYFSFNVDSMWLVYEDGCKGNSFHESTFTLSYAYKMRNEISAMKWKNGKENNQKKYNWGNEQRRKVDLLLEKCREQRCEKRE